MGEKGPSPLLVSLFIIIIVVVVMTEIPQELLVILLFDIS
jgi:hypothetical protein